MGVHVDIFAQECGSRKTTFGAISQVPSIRPGTLPHRPD